LLHPRLPEKPSLRNLSGREKGEGMARRLAGGAEGGGVEGWRDLGRRDGKGGRAEGRRGGGSGGAEGREGRRRRAEERRGGWSTNLIPEKRR
jgi:hypothetical protein